MRHTIPPLPALCLAAALLSSPSVARAQAAAAAALFDQGRAALAAGDLDAACAKFRASDKIDPAAGTKANLGDCEQRRAHVASAWEAYRGALDKLPPGDARVAIIRDRVKRLEARLPKLVLSLAAGAPKDTSVREGDVTLGSDATYGAPLPLDPGVHHLTVTAGGREPKAVDVTLAEGKTTTLVVDPGPASAHAEAPPSAPAPTSSPSSASSTPEAPKEVAPAGPAAAGRLVVHVRSESPAVTLMAEGPDGEKPLCRVPCDKILAPKAEQQFFISGDGVTTSDTFRAAGP